MERDGNQIFHYSTFNADTQVKIKVLLTKHTDYKKMDSLTRRYSDSVLISVKEDAVCLVLVRIHNIRDAGYTARFL